MHSSKASRKVSWKKEAWLPIEKLQTLSVGFGMLSEPLFSGQSERNVGTKDELEVGVEGHDHKMPALHHDTLGIRAAAAVLMQTWRFAGMSIMVGSIVSGGRQRFYLPQRVRREQQHHDCVYQPSGLASFTCR